MAPMPTANKVIIRRPNGATPASHRGKTDAGAEGAAVAAANASVASAADLMEGSRTISVTRTHLYCDIS
jgi:hypothetical protein